MSGTATPDQWSWTPEAVPPPAQPPRATPLPNPAPNMPSFIPPAQPRRPLTWVDLPTPTMIAPEYQNTPAPPVMQPVQPPTFRSVPGAPAYPAQPAPRPISSYPPLLNGIILGKESSGQYSVSPKGAIGTGQIMPETAARYGVSREQLFDPNINAWVRQQETQRLWNKYRDPTAVLIGYNAGDGVVDRWLASGRDPSVLPAETQRYIEGTGLPGALPYQQLLPPEARGPDEWGKPFRMEPGMDRPGMMPGERDIPGIMRNNMLPLLLVASLATRLHGATAINALAAFISARNQRQILDQKLNQTKWQNALKETTAQQELEGQAYGEAFAEAGDNPQALDQRLAAIANRFGDGAMLNALGEGGAKAAYELQEYRDQHNQNLQKLNAQQQKMQLDEQKFMLEQQATMLRMQIEMSTNQIQRQRLQSELAKNSQAQQAINQQRQAEGLPPLPAAGGDGGQMPAQPSLPSMPSLPSLPAPTTTDPNLPPPPWQTTPPATETAPPSTAMPPPSTAAPEPSTATPPPAAAPPAAPAAAAPPGGQQPAEPAPGAPAPAPGVTSGVANWNTLTPQEQSEAARIGESIAQGQNPDMKGVSPGVQAFAQSYAAQVQNSLDRLNHLNVKPGDLMAAVEAADPNRAAMIQAIIDGRYEEPSGFSARNPFWAGVLQLANKIDPTLDATTFKTRAATYKAFTSGIQSRNLVAVGTAERHLEALDAAIAERPDITRYTLGAGGWPLNWTADQILTAVAGRSQAAQALSAYNTNVVIAANEIAKALASGGTTAEADRRQWEARFAASNTGPELRAAVGAARLALKNRLNVLQENFAAGSGRPTEQMLPLFRKYNGAAQAADIARVEADPTATPPAAPSAAPDNSGWSEPTVH